MTARRAIFPLEQIYDGVTVYLSLSVRVTIVALDSEV